MSPEQFLAKLAKQPPAPAYLFLGQEGYQRAACKQALLDRVLPGDARSAGLTQTDLENTTLSAVLDDARSLSLFSSDRVIWVCGAELALPRRVTTNDNGEETAGAPDTELRQYLNGPSPGTVIVFECSRYDFAGDDKPKLERVERFYAAVPAVVEFRAFTPESSRFLAQELAKKHNLKLGGAELAMLLDAVAGDASRLATEIEKLSLFVGTDRKVTAEDLAALVPNAAQSTIFSLVNALGKRDRQSALRSLDILIREGEYLPLALTFLSTQFRLALAAKEARLSTSQQAQAFFTKIGVRIWRDRAEQVMTTAGAFTREHLAKAVALIYDTDRKFRDGYRDDRVVMESLVLALTSRP
ncbi:MAG: DNA polymerase III subunit delta [Acidobacteriaceae bacterium]|nr:DNA polymerase III subunit delta [Acidobacteriaceae bacterium]MBV8570769.1 DNA polymerase III subunit delta [Acidobacteriaceae bacterium]